MTTAPAYAIGYLRDVRFGDDIIEYMERFDSTLAPFGGEFIVHGGALSPREGEWDGDVIIIRFPSVEAATSWYDSPAYQAIVPLRTANSEGRGSAARTPRRRQVGGAAGVEPQRLTTKVRCRHLVRLLDSGHERHRGHPGRERAG